MPHWSPDGKQIASFAETTGKPARIFVVPFDGGTLQQLTNGRQFETASRWP
jgi:Tol biopolymer transport system component